VCDEKKAPLISAVLQGKWAIELVKDAAMKKLSTVLAVALLLSVCLSGSILAQDEEEEYEKDFMEAAIFFGGSMPMGGLTDWTVTNDQGSYQLGTDLGFNFGLDVGYFITAPLVVGFNLTVSQYTIDPVVPNEADVPAIETRHHRIFSPAAYLKYYFWGESNLVPYVKASAGLDVVKFTTRVYDANVGGDEYRELSYDPGFAFGIGGGIFYYTHDYGGLYLEANYHHGLTKDVESDYGNAGPYTFGETASVLDVHVGIKVFFGGE
jgi:hypothetical protein